MIRVSEDSENGMVTIEFQSATEAARFAAKILKEAPTVAEVGDAPYAMSYTEPGLVTT